MTLIEFVDLMAEVNTAINWTTLLAVGSSMIWGFIFGRWVGNRI